MPIYEYQCQKCGVIEVTQRITEKALVKCPTCKNKIKKLISNTSFQLKGTGWYVTDYARKGQTNGDSKTENGSKPAPSPSTETKSDTNKSDTKKTESSSSSDKTTSTSNTTTA
jgi:putative FmdB family regulatory protein